MFVLKFGIGSSFSLIYLSNFIFPVAMASQTLGFVNTFARIFTIPSGLIAQVEQPIPMSVTASLMLVAAGLSLLLEVGDNSNI